MKDSKPSYSELEKRILELEQENLRYKEVWSTLEESEERLRSILDNSIAVIYLKDVEGKYLFINSRYEELFHVTKNDFIGKTDFDLFPKDVADNLQKNDRKIIINNASLEFEEEVLHDDGLHTYISIKFPLKKIDGTIYAVCGISTDITERKHMQELLQQAHDDLENRVDERTKDLQEINEKLRKEIIERKEVEKFLNIFKYAVENSSDAIGMSTPEGEHWYQNKVFNELFGDIGNDPPASLYVSEGKGREVFKTIIAGEQWSGEVEVKTRDNRVITVNLRAYPVKDIAENIISLVGMHTDISSQKASEKALLLSNEKLRKEIIDRKEVEKSLNIFKDAVENSFDAIGMATPEGNHWYQNRTFTELFGNLKDHPSSLYVNKDIADEMFRVIMAGGQWSGEVAMRSVEGNEATINLRAYPIKDGKGAIVALVGAHTDISSQKASEKALLLSEEKYRDLVDRTPDLLYRTDLNGEIVFISPSVYRLSGYTVEESIGIKMAEEVYLHPEERKNFLKELSENGSVENFEAPLVRKDGSIWWASTNAHFFKDENGVVQGVEGITRDITNLKNAEKEREELAQQLNREEKMKSLGLMAGGIAHDLNNILSGIVSYPDFVLMKLPEDSPLRRPLEVIKDSGQRAADVVSDLLTIARGVAAGKEVLNMNQVIEDYSSSAEHVSLVQKYPNISFKNILEPELLNLLGSKVHMKKILMNLVTNAAEAISLKGVVTVSSGNRYLDKPLKGYDTINIGEYIMISVRDTGSGIPEENLSRIFEPFYTKKVMGKSGTGLGLAVVWNAVQDHDAYINVESNSSGTTFDLYFQVYREEIQPEEEPVLIETLSGNGEVILVVDDEERQREIARELLGQLGYTVYSVSSGEEALEYLEDNCADLLILDMIMDPGIDGLETYRRILKNNPAQKAIISSGYSETERVLEAQSLGVGSYIKKPYVIQAIGKAIKKELNNL